MLRLLTATATLLAVVVLGPGCSHYRLGTGAPLPFQSIQIDPVANHTLAPQLQPILSARLREGFIRDSRVQVVNSGSAADASLSLAISGYQREIATVREGDTGLARKFNVTLSVTGTLRDTRTGKVIWESRTFTATREVFTDGGQLQSEYQVVPLLAESLAPQMVRAVLDQW
jgi:hypothetical protein